MKLGEVPLMCGGAGVMAHSCWETTEQMKSVEVTVGCPSVGRCPCCPPAPSPVSVSVCGYA